jgi:hypothetical protein
MGLGAFVGAIANRLIDLLQEKRRQQFELRKKLFDIKVDTTLRCIKTMKYGSEVFLIATKRLEEILAMSFSEDMSVAVRSTLAAELEKATKGLEVLTDDSLGAESLLGFFYGDRLLEIAKQQETQQQAVRSALFEIFDEFEKITVELKHLTERSLEASAEEAKAALKEDILALLRRFVALRPRAKELRMGAESLDATSNEVIALVRRDYAKLGM